jgi:hypothetical protein
MLQEALKAKEEFGGTITEYLLEKKYLSEENLAKCICEQFGVPYIPLRAYQVPKETVELIPADLAVKYLVMPLDKIEDVVTVVMVDPLNEDVIKEIERITACTVQPFVGIISDIVKAIERYYRVKLDRKGVTGHIPAPLFIGESKYVGPERRRAVRLKVDIGVHFPIQKQYLYSKMKNVSQYGILFESKNILPLNSFIMLQIDLPKSFSRFPLAAVVRVVRVAELSANRFDVGGEIAKISKEDLQALINFANSQQK